MNFIIAHSDFDGVLSASIIYSKVKNAKILFSSANLIKKLLCKIIAFNEDLENLYVADISVNEKILKLASLFSKVYWFDHHISNINSNFENVELIIDINKKSCSRLVAEYFNFFSEWIEIADKIDCNNCTDQLSKDIRDYFYAIKYYYKSFSSVIYSKISKNLINLSPIEFLKKENVKETIEKYRNEMKELMKTLESKVKIVNINGYNVAIANLENFIPTSYVYNSLSNIDLLIAVYTKEKPKIEFRSNKINVFELAKEFGGGGHKNASGATLSSYISIEEIEEKIKELLAKIS